MGESGAAGPRFGRHGHRHRFGRNVGVAVAALIAVAGIAPVTTFAQSPKANCKARKSCTTTTSSTTTTAPSTTSTTVASTSTTSTTAAPSTQTTSTCSGVAVSPGADIQSVFNAYGENTTFCFAPGVYRMSKAAVPKSGSVISGAPGAVLNGSRVITTFGRSGSYWVITGQTQQFAPFGRACEPSTYDGCHYPESVFVNNAPLWQVTSLSELAPGRFYFDYGADTIYLADDPTGRTVEVTVAPAAIIGYGGTTGQQNVTVRGFVIEKFAATLDQGQVGAVKAGWNWTIENNEIRLNHAAAVAVNNGTVLRNNSLHHNGQYGFSGGPLDRLLVEGNDIGFNNTEGWSLNDDAGGCKIIRSTNLTFRNNRVHDNKGPGLWTDWENKGVTFEGNTLERNVGPGIFHEASADAVIRNNTLRGNGTYAAGKSLWWSADILLNDSKSTEIYGNTVDAGVHGIGLVDVDRGSTAYGLLEIRDVYVHDNKVTLPAGGLTGLVGSRSTAYTSANNRFDRNSYYVSDVSGASWEWNGTKTRTQWQGSGQDLSGSFYSWAP